MTTTTIVKPVKTNNQQDNLQLPTAFRIMRPETVNRHSSKNIFANSLFIKIRRQWKFEGVGLIFGARVVFELFAAAPSPKTEVLKHRALRREPQRTSNGTRCNFSGNTMSSFHSIRL